MEKDKGAEAEVDFVLHTTSSRRQRAASSRYSFCTSDCEMMLLKSFRSILGGEPSSTLARYMASMIDGDFESSIVKAVSGKAICQEVNHSRLRSRNAIPK